MTKINERIKALEHILQQKTKELQQIETLRNNTITEIVKNQGKIDLLKELEVESNEEKNKKT